MRRVEVPGSHPELGYPLDRSKRFVPRLISIGGASRPAERPTLPLLNIPVPMPPPPPHDPVRVFAYRYGPQPMTVEGGRALEYVLDAPALKSADRTLMFSLKLVGVQRA